jgi:hypothetical protein
MWKVIARLTVAAAMALVVSSHFALGGDRVPKSNAGCVQLSNAATMCLTCQDGPCNIRTGPGNPITISKGWAIAHHSSANSPKPKISADHPFNSDTKP